MKTKLNQKGSALTVMLFLILALTIGFIGVDVQEERGPALLFSGVFFMIGVVWIKRLVGKEDAEEFISIFSVAYFLRLIVCVMLHYGADYQSFAEDDYAYHVVGWRIAQMWHGTYHTDLLSGFALQEMAEAKKVSYSYVIAAFYYFLGAVPLVPKVFNVFVGSMIVVYLGKFCRDVSGKEAAKWTLWFSALFPSMILWSGLLLRDCIVTFAIVYTLYHSHTLVHRKTLLSGVKVGLGLLVLGTMRGYMFLLLSACLALGFFIRGKKHFWRNYAVGILLVLMAFFIYQRFEFGKMYATTASFEALNGHRRSLATGNSAIHVDADISSPGKALVYLPIGVTYFLFAPFPWSIKGLRQAYALPEVLVWYFLFIYFLRGMRLAFRQAYSDYAVVINLVIVVTLTYSLVEGNLGTAYRHRFQVMGFYLMFTAIGLAQKLAKVREQKKATQPSLRPSLSR